MTQDDTFIHLPVYEPIGRDLRLTETDCLQHLLVIGATGCGKTTLLRRITAQLIARPETALLIMDAKQDDTVEFIRREAAKHRRDVVVLGNQGTHAFDLFAPLQSLTDVDRMVKRMLVGTQSMGRENEFWNEIRVSLIDAALTLLVLVKTPVQYESAMELMSDLFFRQPELDGVGQLKSLLDQSLSQSPPAIARKMRQTRDTLEMWSSLDPRTRGNVQATLVNALRPFSSLSAGRCFEPGQRAALDMKQLVEQGGICVVSLNATTEPELAGLLFKLAKKEFTGVVQQRRDNRERLCALIADELPLLVTPDEVETLATIRSRRCLVCAATQGLAVLDQKLGPQMRKALVANFGSVIIMRGREEETDLMAAVQMGFSTYHIKVPRLCDEGGMLSFQMQKLPQQRLACPPGRLGSLSPHQAFVTLPNQTRYEDPVWFVPYFEEPEKQSMPEAPPAPVSNLTDPADPQRLHRQLQAQGFTRWLNQAQWDAAMALFPRRRGRKRALAEAVEFFRSRAVLVPTGLELLPLPWLKALPRILWSLRQPHWTHLPYMIREVLVADGLLQFRFAQEAVKKADDLRAGAYDELRQAVNTRLYPACYRPLKPAHARRLRLPPPDVSLDP